MSLLATSGTPGIISREPSVPTTYTNRNQQDTGDCNSVSSTVVSALGSGGNVQPSSYIGAALLTTRPLSHAEDAASISSVPETTSQATTAYTSPKPMSYTPQQVAALSDALDTCCGDCCCQPLCDCMACTAHCFELAEKCCSVTVGKKSFARKYCGGSCC